MTLCIEGVKKLLTWSICDEDGDWISDESPGVGDAGAGPIHTFYFGLINNAGFVAVSSADTMLSHAGWTEFAGQSGNRKQIYLGNTDYVLGTHVMRHLGGLAIDLAGTLAGFFVVGDSNVEGSSAGFLLGVAKYETPLDVNPGDSLVLEFIPQGVL